MKPWTKYTFELIILFMGISAAFFVENYRLSIEEQKNYQLHLMGIQKDLINDSLTFDNTIHYLDKYINYSDSLLSQNDESNEWTINVIGQLLMGYPLSTTSVTFGSLSNSNIIELSNNLELKSSIIDYYHIQKVLDERLEDYEIEQSEIQTYLIDKFSIDDIKFNYSTMKYEPKKGAKSSRLTKIDKFIIRNYLLHFKEHWIFQRDLLKRLCLKRIKTNLNFIEKELNTK